MSSVNYDSNNGRTGWFRIFRIPTYSSYFSFKLASIRVNGSSDTALNAVMSCMVRNDYAYITLDVKSTTYTTTKVQVHKIRIIKDLSAGFYYIDAYINKIGDTVGTTEYNCFFYLYDLKFYSSNWTIDQMIHNTLVSNYNDPSTQIVVPDALAENQILCTQTNLTTTSDPLTLSSSVLFYNSNTRLIKDLETDVCASGTSMYNLFSYFNYNNGDGSRLALTFRSGEEINNKQMSLICIGRYNIYYLYIKFSATTSKASAVLTRIGNGDTEQTDYTCDISEDQYSVTLSVPKWFPLNVFGYTHGNILVTYHFISQS